MKTERRWLRSAVRYGAFMTAAAVGCFALTYALAYICGAAFALTGGAIVARYPAALKAAVASHRGTYVPFGALPRCAIDGVISVEDKRFFHNPGIDPIALFRVAFATLKGAHGDQGGSTITQQLARLIIDEPRSQPSLAAEFWSEVQVVKYGLITAHDFSKDEILELYLNSVYYGRGAHGFAAAAKTYFGTAPANLSQAQCYYLTGLPQAPSYFGSHPAAAAARYQHVLSTLERNGFITPMEQRQLALKAPDA